MSLKPKTNRKDLLKKLAVGQVVKGVVQRLKDFGIFIQLQDSSLVGFAHKSELADKFVKDIQDFFKEGQGNLFSRLMTQQNPSLTSCLIRGITFSHT